MNYLHCSVTKYSVLCMYSILVLIWNRKRCVWRKHMNVVRFFFSFASTQNKLTHLIKTKCIHLSLVFPLNFPFFSQFLLRSLFFFKFLPPTSAVLWLTENVCGYDLLFFIFHAIPKMLWCNSNLCATIIFPHHIHVIAITFIVLYVCNV